jgi:anti-sigma B factor antagonist
MALDNLQISSSKGGRGQTILTLNGALNIHTVFKFQEAVRSDPASTVIIDFSGVPYIDSAGLGAMVGAHVSSRKSNRKIAFAALNDQARTLVEMTHVNQLFHMYDTIADAEAATG